MISLISEVVDRHWDALQESSAVVVPFLEWDDGDVYTLAVGAQLGRSVLGSLCLEPTSAEGSKVLVVFSPVDDGGGPADYRAPDGSMYRVSGEVRASGESLRHDVVVGHIHSELGTRRRGILETDVLSDRSVAIVGVGTGGVHVAVELAKTGVGTFTLVDPDRLELGNVSRHHAGVSFLGRRKVFAAKDLILESNPSAAVTTLPLSASADHEGVLQDVVGKADILICATDNRPSKLFLNRLCLSRNVPAVYGGAFRRAYGGQALRVRPGDSACYHCFVLGMGETEADREISSTEDAEAVAYSDRPVPVEPGLALDVAPISLMTTKLALQELLVGVDSSLHILDRDLDANWYLWANRPEPGTQFASLPPLSESNDDMTVLRWYGVYLAKDPACPSCGDFGGSLTQKYGLQGGPTFRPQPGEPPAGPAAERQN